MDLKIETAKLRQLFRTNSYKIYFENKKTANAVFKVIVKCYYNSKASVTVMLLFTFVTEAASVKPVLNILSE